MKKMFRMFLVSFVLGLGVFLFSHGASATGGYTWTEPDRSDFGSGHIEISTIKTFGDYLYVGIFVYDRTTGIYSDGRILRSNDGASWDVVLETDALGTNPDYSGTLIVPSFLETFSEKIYVGLNDGTILYSIDGLTWNNISTRFSNEYVGLYNFVPMSLFNSQLYVGSTNTSNNHRIEMWRSGSGISGWSRSADVSVFGTGEDNEGVSSMVVFGDKLYLGTYNRFVNGGHGTEVWRSSDGSSWRQVNVDGFGNEQNEATKLVVFGDHLYASMSSSYSGDGKIWRTASGSDWSLITNGFGDSNNVRVPSMEICEDSLYAGTINNDDGLEIWKTEDGSSWNQINENGFGLAENVNANNMEVYNGKLFVTTGGYQSTSPVLPDSKIFYTECSSGDGSSTSSDYEETVTREKSSYAGKDESLTDRLTGRILIQTEEHGEAWYVNPTDEKKYYLGRPQDAFDIMRDAGLGITNENLNKIPTVGTEWTINDDFKGYVLGRIVIQVEENGEAWYVNPTDEKKYYMGRPDDAFQLMRDLGLGISNTDLRRIEVGEL